MVKESREIKVRGKIKGREGSQPIPDSMGKNARKGRSDLCHGHLIFYTFTDAHCKNRDGKNFICLVPFSGKRTMVLYI